MISKGYHRVLTVSRVGHIDFFTVRKYTNREDEIFKKDSKQGE